MTPPLAVAPEPRCRERTAAARVRAVERAVQAMRERLGEPLPLETIARAALSSPYHFNRFFREVTGLPPCRFLAALRLETAKRLLLTTRFSVTRVCYEVGYTSIGSFTRHFASDVGLPPYRLRRFASGGVPRPVLDGEGVESRPASGATVGGRVDAPGGFGGMVFVGAFPEAIPRGRPAACAVLAGPGEFRMGGLPDGRWHVLAAGLDGVPSADALLHDDALRAAAGPVLVRDGRASGPVRLALRPPRPIDPPILISLPVLLAGAGAEEARTTAG
ncbi:MAG TPA: AraC family transcriptional regulator [Longimicrobium sp.]|jgi:AraC-like DNA-binding protein